MERFFWQGINLQGQNVSGIIDAKDSQELNSILLSQNIALIRFKTKNNKNILLNNFFNNKIKIKDKLFFFEQLYILISSGITLLDALSLLQDQINNKNFKNIIIKIIEDIKNGKSFSQALAVYDKIFTNQQINIIKSGESSDKLVIVLDKITKDLNKKFTLIKKLQNAAILPILTLVFSVFLVLGIFIFVIPQFETLFMSFDKELPETTKFMFKVSNYMRSGDIFLFIIFVLLFILLIKYLLNLNFIKKYKDWFVFNFYFLNKIFIYYYLVNFFSILSIFLYSGIDIKKALDLAINTVNNNYLKEKLFKVRESVVLGQSLNGSLKNIKLKFLTSEIISLVTVGEKTGKLDLMLERVALVYEQNLERKIKIFNTFFQPILLILVGFIIVILMLSIYLPIFNVASFV